MTTDPSPTPEPPTCCGRPMLEAGQSTERVTWMKHPPRTTDRWKITERWQCAVQPNDQLERYRTTDDPSEVLPILGGTREAP